MSSTSTPYGAQVVSHLSGIAREQRMQNGILSGLASNIYKFQPIKLNPANGTILPITNTGGVPDPLFGIFMGVEYTPTGGRPAVSPYWASGTVYDSTLDMFVYYLPLWTPGIRIKVQADGTVAQALLGNQFNFTNVGNGSTGGGGVSQCTVGATGVPLGSQGQLILTEFFSAPDSAIGDAYTDLICEIAYPQIGFAAQRSIG